MNDYDEQGNTGSSPMPSGYGGTISQALDAKMAYDPRLATVRRQLQQRLVEMKKQQEQVEKALAALDKIPDVEVLLDLLRKVGV